MKILLVHNHYQQRGGEDAVFADETALLEAHGHDVIRYTVHNDAIRAMGRLESAARTVWNRQTYRELRELMRRERPAVMHCTNTFPLVSPAVFYAARKQGVGVVQTLHNYRLLCPKALFLRDGKVCEDCLGKLFPWPAIQHGCYRESRAATAVVAGMLTTHRLLGTYRKAIDRYIALTEFARQKFIQGGLPAERIVVKPNFVSPDLGVGTGNGGYAIVVGRLSEEKGIEALLAAWESSAALPPLKIVGDGPLADRVRAAAAQDTRIEWLGALPGERVQQLVGDAAMLVFPSICYEGLPKVIVEAFSRGTPVVASRMGSMPELVEPCGAGLLFAPGNAAELAGAVESMLQHRSRLSVMRRNAREEFQRRYTAERNHAQLIDIYTEAIQSRGLLPPVAKSIAPTRPQPVPQVLEAIT